MKNNMKRAFIGILAASLAAASLTVCALLDKLHSLPGNDSTSQSAASSSGQPEQSAYSIDIPAEGWNQASPGMWAAQEDSKILTNVRIWVVSFEGQTAEEAEKTLSADDYRKEGDVLQREQDSIISKAVLHESGGDAWGVFYSYPTAEAEKWDTQMSEIAGTFQLSSR